MCGIVALFASANANRVLYDALTVLQHRGQDAAGIMTIDENNKFYLRKANGLVRDVFDQKHMHRLKGNLGLGHVRYPTAGSASSDEAQPMYVNSPFGISLAHNGNITNQKELLNTLKTKYKRHINTNSDSEILLNILASALEKNFSKAKELTCDDIFKSVEQLIEITKGGYAVVSYIFEHGILAFRDPNAIRPIVFGKREIDGKTEYMFASESVALDVADFKVIRDLKPGEAIFIDKKGNFFSKICTKKENKKKICLFEYVYLARPDSFIEDVSVYAARVKMGEYLGKKIKEEYSHLNIDVVIPIPETSNDIALEISYILNIPYRQGFVKNRYIGRTFIMAVNQNRKRSIKHKLNAIAKEFKGKNVLLVDDSIVRGNTSKEIVKMARLKGAKEVYFASSAPKISFPNVYGIDMPSFKELIAHERSTKEIAKEIGVDCLIYQSIQSLKKSVLDFNKELDFEDSVFSGNYIHENITAKYLLELENKRKLDKQNDKDFFSYS